MNPLSCWPLLNQVNPHFLSRVRQFLSLGQNGSCLLLILKDGSVHGIGADEAGVLGLGSRWNNIKKNPQELMELRGKEIVEMVGGTSHVLALSQNGRVWSWGQNQSGQLGVGSAEEEEECLRPTMIPDGSFDTSMIVSIKCDSHYSMALSANGLVYQWGWISDVTNTKQSAPRRLKIIEQFKVVQIACSYSHSMALTRTGLVYVWGSNVCGKLGTLNFEHKPHPVPIMVNTGIRVRQIACGMEHSLLLTSDGHCYSFGSNNIGQLGVDTLSQEMIELNRPTLVVDSQQKPYKFRSIAAYQRLSVAVSASDDHCYVWGEFASDNLCKRKPSKTPLISVDSALGFYTVTKNTQHLVKFDGYQSINQSVMRLSGLFDNPQSGDLRIECLQEKVIYVHRAFLIANSGYFRGVLSRPPYLTEVTTDVMSSKTLNHLTLTDYPYPVCYAYLQYLYTNRTLQLDQSQLVQLLDLALSYSESDLKQHCIDVLCDSYLTIDNCCQLYQFAVRNDLGEFKNFLVLFFARNILQVYQSQGFCTMDDRLCKMLALDYAKIMD